MSQTRIRAGREAKLIGHKKEGELSKILTEKTGTKYTIPKDEANTDYQEYLEWAKTNTAEAAD